MQDVNQLLDIFQGYRMAPTPKDQYEEKGKEILKDKMNSFLSLRRPIDFVMLGFPFKSTNTRDKVLGEKPDAAEEATLVNFSSFNNDIRKVYQPGVRIHIVSDGLIFNDLLGVKDDIVYEYKEINEDLGKDSPVEWYDLNSFYRSSPLTSREKVITQFGVTPEQLETAILFNPDVNFLYRGMVRFMEEELAPHSYPSNHQREKAAKILTRQMMFRNEAYSNLVRKEFSSMIRLSMHPSINDGAKYSFQLIPGKARFSAWHSALVRQGSELLTMHKADAEKQGYELVYKDNQPYYFQA